MVEKELQFTVWSFVSFLELVVGDVTLMTVEQNCSQAEGASEFRMLCP